MEDRRAALEARYPRWPGWTLASALDAVAAEHPDRPFVLTDEGTWSYDELAAWSRRLARGLVAKGVKSGQNVALLLPNSPELVALFFAIARARAVAVPISIALREREYSYIVQQSDSVALLTPEQVRGLEHDPDPALDAELARRAEEASAADDATIFYTSGTTGQPKGVMLTHDMELRSAYGSAYTRAFEDGRRILFALPLNHVFAYIEGLLATLFVGGGAIIQPRFSPVGSLEAIARHGANEALFVPTMSLAVVDAPRSGSYDTSTQHTVI
jgi:fatty-acyl-CoA synthase